MIANIGDDVKQCEHFNNLIREMLSEDGLRWELARHFDADRFWNRFPISIWAQQPEKCERLLWRLAAAAEDAYDHEVGPLETYVLIRSVEDWLRTAQQLLGNATEVKAAAFLRQRVDLLDELQVALDEHSEVALVPGVANDLLNDGDEYLDRRMNLRDYRELIPDSIWARVERELHVRGDLPRSEGPTRR